MIILVSGNNVSVTVSDEDMMNGVRKFYAYAGSYYNGFGYYDPENEFKPCFRSVDDKRKRLAKTYAEEYMTLLDEANKAFDKMVEKFKPSKPAAPATVSQSTAPASSGLGNQLETIMLKVLAEQSVDKVLDVAKPILEQHIKDTFGVLPQVHEIKTPTETRKITGITHEMFDTVLNLVNADIPVFLTGPAGTGKNVICKQVAESLGLEFYFSNAVTQEYKITGFIDANGHYNQTQFYEAFTKGGVFMLDEMDASIPEVLVMLNAAIANRYFDFPTGRVDAHPDFRLIAAGNTFGTGADIEYTGRYQLDAASLDRFAMVTIDYSIAIENAIAQGDSDLVDFVHAFRAATTKTGIKHLATYRAIDRIKKLDGMMPMDKVLEIALYKGMGADDKNVLINEIRSNLPSSNRYLTESNKLVA